MGSEFKNLPVNRDKLDEVLEQYPGLKDYKKKEKPNGLTQYNINIDDKKSLLNVYFLRNGGTTFTPCGKNQELSKSIAGFLKANCSRGDGGTKSIRLTNFTEDHKDLLLEYLVEECTAKIENPENHPHGTKYKITGKHGDSVAFWVYTNGACHIQGKQFAVFTDILEMLAEILDYQDVIDSQLKTISVDITVEEALKDMKELLPSSFDFMQEKLKAIVSPALALKKLDIELTDYSSFVFPVLRGLEGYMKQVLSNFGINIGRDGFKEILEQKNNGKPELKEEISKKINNAGKEKVILDLYKYYNSHRHSLFHVDTVIEATKTLENKAECISLIDSTISLIEKSHIKLF